MYALPLFAVFGILTIRALFNPAMPKDLSLPARLGNRLDKLWAIVHECVKEKRYLRAEKALLTILRVDERNATAYNRLGILYAKQHAYKNAIECFEIAQSLEPSASSLHNVGLIYFETKQYEKAALAFEQAIALESELPARYIAYAKVQEKLGNTRKMINSLEKAVELEPNPQTLTVLADAYQRNGDLELAQQMHNKVTRMRQAGAGQARKRIAQPRKVVM